MEERLCILVVDDDADTLKLMTRLLNRHGYDVHPARTSEQAEERVNGCGLIISDIVLGAGDGLELMRDLKSRYGLKGIAVSGHAEPDDVQDAKEAGFDRFIAKPISLEDLLDTIRELMAQAVPIGSHN
jgi:two-component system KDP operon response regulator KdpE